VGVDGSEAVVVPVTNVESSLVVVATATSVVAVVLSSLEVIASVVVAVTSVEVATSSVLVVASSGTPYTTVPDMVPEAWMVRTKGVGPTVVVVVA
jgi:hypothetical protein